MVAFRLHMALTKEDKTQLVGEHRRSDEDTGSAEVQVAILSKRIAELTEHLKTHTKDHAPVVGCCRWSAAGGGCSTTSSVRTSSATAN